MNRRAQAHPFMGMHLPHSTLMKATVAAGDEKPATWGLQRIRPVRTPKPIGAKP